MGSDTTELFFWGGGGVLVGAVWTGEPAFTCLCAEPGSGPSERGEHRPFEWGRRVCGGFVFCPGGSAAWPQCWLCAVFAVGHISCCVGGGVSLYTIFVCFEAFVHESTTP